MGEKDMTEIRHVDEVLKLLTVISGDKRYYEETKSEKGKVKNMCEVADRLVNKGIEQGRKDGRKEGLREGSIKTLFEMIKRKIITIDQAADIAGLSPEALMKEVEKVKNNEA